MLKGEERSGGPREEIGDPQAEHWGADRSCSLKGVADGSGIVPRGIQVGENLAKRLGRGRGDGWGGLR
uniref:Uncharacterized protein n=1 Tax=Tetraselmis sp. GSL018 TaxID=582737 RepID=A0A061RG01_9CHLO